jgi:DNA mismatch endonuclease (patch repair protein)
MESPAVRRRTMQAVKSKDTSVEMCVRQSLHAQGYRYRLHQKNLPGSPDIVFGSRRKVIFIHGCFWHGHQCPRGRRVPKTNTDYWTAKIARNSMRDVAALKKLYELGWKASVVWECELTKNTAFVIKGLARFLGPTAKASP